MKSTSARSKDRAAGCHSELQKFIMLLVSSGDTPITGRQRFHNTMFLLSDINHGLGKQCRYRPGADGPYSKAADDALLGLERMGLVSISGREISATKEGARVAKRLAKDVGRELACMFNAELLSIMDKMNNSVSKMVDDFKKFAKDLTPNELLAYICATRPDMVESARCRETISKLEESVMSMLRKEKINYGHAAELMRIPYWEMRDKMKKAGLLVLSMP